MLNTREYLTDLNAPSFSRHLSSTLLILIGVKRLAQRNEWAAFKIHRTWPAATAKQSHRGWKRQHMVSPISTNNKPTEFQEAHVQVCIKRGRIEDAGKLTF